TRLGLGREVWPPWRQRIVTGSRLGSEEAVVAQERRQGNKTDAAGRGGQEVAAAAEGEVVRGVHGNLRPSSYVCFFANCSRTHWRKEQMMLKQSIVSSGGSSSKRLVRLRSSSHPPFTPASQTRPGLAMLAPSLPRRRHQPGPPCWLRFFPPAWLPRPAG